MLEATHRSENRTIDDVALHAGVSKGTVSNVLNGKAHVTAATRARVEQAIAELGYRPSESARSLTARKRYMHVERGLDASLARLTTVGYLSVDFTAELDRLPEREERRFAKAIDKSIGGPAANVAAIAAGIGEPYEVAASLITDIGVDQDSDWAAAQLSSRHVHLVVPPHRREGRISRALVLVEADGRRTIINEPSRLGAVDIERFLESADPTGLNWCLHLEGYQVPTQLTVVEQARARGFITSMQSTGLPPQWLRQHRDRVFACFDVVMLHQESLDHLGLCSGDPPSGIRRLAELATAARGRWPRLIVVTLGKDGAAAVMPNGSVVRAAALPVTVLDTTGAGDSFVGCFLAVWLNCADAALALRLACVAGSLQVTRFGAQEVRPDAATLALLAPQAAAAAAIT
ncbi:MAG: PfkB family carbohydrate kinase [Variovorax sp.]